MEILIESLAEYGPLGLWTASLLYANYQTRKDAKEEVIDKLQQQHGMLEKALEKLDAGLVTMREKYAEERIRNMQNNNQQ